MHKLDLNFMQKKRDLLVFFLNLLLPRYCFNTTFTDFNMYMMALEWGHSFLNMIRQTLLPKIVRLFF